MKSIVIRLAAGVLAAALPVAAAAEDTPPHIDTSGVNMQPAYPASAMQNKERGAVVLRVGATEAGTVSQIRLLQTSGFNDLDAAAITGVMAWRFISARSDGRPVAGFTNVEIAFEPPDDANSAPPKPDSDYLPSLLHMEAARGKFHAERVDIPCSSGLIQTTVEFLHSNGPAGSGWAPSTALGVEKGPFRKPGTDWLRLNAVGWEGVIPPQEKFELTAGKGDDSQTHLTYSYSANLGMEETLSISWDATGQVKATLGGMESHEIKFETPPDNATFSVSGGAVNFHDSALICYPSLPEQRKPVPIRYLFQGQSPIVQSPRARP